MRDVQQSRALVLTLLDRAQQGVLCHVVIERLQVSRA
jgi:hypothetical protein